ncbi:hypothetical protein AB0K80_06755 [Streptomyces sp. NPDC052682]|uniref:hypothetical protein n=1 Tax=Streptomyces sp. NPDC052682 TaxID=3154954 RepID=UPI0034453124
MADEQYRWLDRETAERLLSGEPLDAVDPAAREQAQRLARTLGALSAPPPASEELPGEAAALAAFRAARAARGAAADTPGRPSGTQFSEAGLVRIGGPARTVRRPRWARPARLGLAAALTVGMVGSVAVAAGTGVLPTPSFVGGEPDPAASVSAEVTPPGRPLLPPSPHDSAQGGGTSGAPSGEPSHGIAGGPDADEPSGGATPRPGTRPDTGGHGSGDLRKDVESACRALRDGKGLDSGRKRALDRAAGGSARVWTYCKGVLAAGGDAARDGKGGGKSDGEGSGKSGGEGRGDDRGPGQDKGQDDGKGSGKSDGEGHRGGRGRGHPHGLLAPSARPESASPQKTTTLPGTSPRPTYSAL